MAHREAYEAAYLNPSGAAAASHELARLEREWRTLPPRHSCSCPRLNKRTGIVEYHCLECRRLGEQIPKQDVAVEIGRGKSPGSRVPNPAMLDLARAEDVLGIDADAGSLARYMSLDGHTGQSALAQALSQERPTQRHTPVATELVCLSCGRPGVAGQRYCSFKFCGGSLIQDAVIDPS